MSNKPNFRNHLGEISNLITDMTIKGASTNELRVVINYSVAILDLEKLWVESDIEDLFDKYQS